jgi:cobalamin biosynthesis protein CobW
VILNKTDLMSDAERKDVTAEIGRTLPRSVKVVETVNGQVPVAVLLGLGAKAESDLASRPSHHDAEGEHDHDDFDTFIIDLPAFDTPQVLVERIAKATTAHDILRVKGFVDIAGKPMRLLVQGVGSRIQHQFDKRWPDGSPRLGRLVVIGETGLDRAAIQTLILG